MWPWLECVGGWYAYRKDNNHLPRAITLIMLQGIWSISVSMHICTLTIPYLMHLQRHMYIRNHAGFTGHRNFHPPKIFLHLATWPYPNCQCVQAVNMTRHSCNLKADRSHPGDYSTHRQTPWTDNDSSLVFAALGKAEPLGPAVKSANRQTDTHTQRTENITSSANAGGNNAMFFECMTAE